MSVPYERRTNGHLSALGRQPGRAGPGRTFLAPFQRLSESERLARDLAALVAAGLIIAVDDGDEMRFATTAEQLDRDEADAG
jgi:hypothetical protein